MPDCREIAALLSGYLDRDLPPETCAAIGAHLDSCAACRDAAVSLRRTVDLCRQYRVGDLPGPLPEARQQELKAAFERALATVGRRRSESR